MSLKHFRINLYVQSSNMMVCCHVGITYRRENSHNVAEDKTENKLTAEVRMNQLRESVLYI